MRAARGWLLAGSSGLLAVSAHVAADGAVPDPSLTIVLAALIGWVGTSLADRTRGIAGILATLATAQVVMHFTLTALDAHAGSDGGTLSVAMTATHGIATLLTAVLVCHAERGLDTFASAVRRILPVAWTAPPPPHGKPPRVLAPVVGSRHVEVLLRRVCARRGPPLHS